MPSPQTVYLRAAHTFRAVLDGLGAADLTRPVPTCPGWTVSDVVTHVLETHERALGPERTAAAEHGDLMAAYAVAVPEDPVLTATAPVDALELTVHAWDVAIALDAELRFADDQLDFLEALAAEAGERLYLEDGFERLEGAAADPSGLDRQGVTLLLFGRRAPA